MVLPSQFDEALRIPRSMGPTCLSEGNRVAPQSYQQKGVTELMRYHKVAESPPQPRARGPIEADWPVGIWNCRPGSG